MSQDQLLIAVRRSGLCMATCRLSSIGNTVQPVRKEPGTDERNADGKRESTLEHDRRRHLGYASRKSRKTPEFRWLLKSSKGKKPKGREFFKEIPQDNYPDALDKYRKIDERETMGNRRRRRRIVRIQCTRLSTKPTVPEKRKSNSSLMLPEKSSFAGKGTTGSTGHNRVGSSAYNTTLVGTDCRCRRTALPPVTVAFGIRLIPHPAAPAQAAQPAAPAAPACRSGSEILSPLEGKFFLVKKLPDTPLKVGYSQRG